MRRVVITGMAAISCIDRTLPDVLRSLQNGQS
jgi:hypothetical protein